MLSRASYWRRIAEAYVFRRNSNLTFWHERPSAHPEAEFGKIGPYYMTFADKADYPGPFDAAGVPLLDYRGAIGRQHNPIAIAQYGLAHYNKQLRPGFEGSRAIALRQADWLVRELKPNRAGLAVWHHHFDFEYRETLRAPWYSGLAQGQGISLLARAYALTGDERYLDSARSAFASFGVETGAGGVLFTDGNGDPWIEEYVVEPPTHILNGFIWALWGVRDYGLVSGDPQAELLFTRCAGTLERNLHRYDTAFWSLYELSGTALPMLASPFYHALHLVQLQLLHRMTGAAVFADTERRWRGYASRRLNRARSLAQKALFKILYY